MDKKSVLSGILANGTSFKLGEFVSMLQGFSLGLRHEHWRTKSYALHKALEQTQDTLDDLIDTFVEAYIGSIGGNRPEFQTSISESLDPDSIIRGLKGLDLYDSSLLNIRDEMLQALYKFKYLKTLS